MKCCSWIRIALCSIGMTSRRSIESRPLGRGRQRCEVGMTASTNRVRSSIPASAVTRAAQGEGEEVAGQTRGRGVTVTTERRLTHPYRHT
jgi:hypothetical protein